MTQRHWRIGLFALCTFTVLLGWTQAAYASKLSVSLNRATGRPGEEVTLSLTAKGQPERLTSVLSLDLHYDPQQLTIKTYRNGRAIGPNQLVLVETAAPGTIKIAVTDMAKPTEPMLGLASGELASFTFTIQPQAKKGRLPLTLEGVLALDRSGKGIKQVRQTNGTIVVKPAARQRTSEASTTRTAL